MSNKYNLIKNVDTIIALATPKGIGGVSIVRLSGKDSYLITDKFIKLRNKKSIAVITSRKLYNCFVLVNNEQIDNCLVVRFQAPYSFTGENVVELHLHGNPFLVDLIIQIAVDYGARLAKPGEFTKQSFLNGKIDLTQVEALAFLIQSESQQALIISQKQYNGELNTKLISFREQIIQILSYIELELDFVEDGYSFSNSDVLDKLLSDLKLFCTSLLLSYNSSNWISQGPRILLMGRPNAGKSSLFNSFLGYSRSLVSTQAGTTRDYIEEKIIYSGLSMRFIDTAGIRQTTDHIESEGVRLAQELISMSDHVIYLIDSSDKLNLKSEILNFTTLTIQYPVIKFKIVFTKSDLLLENQKQNIVFDCIYCSIYKTESIIGLLNYLFNNYSINNTEQIALLNQRQFLIIKGIENHLVGLSVDLKNSELLSADLRYILMLISELTGETSNEDILNNIFSSFCIGK
ncbi:MAG: tRNA uridine-5-carboxymethylaminomethyl(34) synthesis GTPase MnmE [Chlorobiota bacterium]|nr:MAG: tRNA uridine-5-carboxymethylaminomethyl(34) synthesis GTPase MnmE [Chlorobiota bacterium]